MEGREIANIKDHLICSICSEIFTDPRILPCSHSLCCHCLEQYIISERRNTHRHNGRRNRRKGFKSIKCPLCQISVDIENERLSDKQIAENFPKNALLADLEKKVKVHESNVPSCETHVEFPSEYFCIEDGAFLCSECAILKHRGFRCNVLTVKDAGEKFIPECNSIRQQYRDKLTELNYMLTKEYKDAIPAKIKSITLNTIKDFEKEIDDFFQNISRSIEDLKKQLESSHPRISSNDSKIRSFIQQTEKKLKDLDEMNAADGSILQLQTFKIDNEKFLADVDKKIVSFSKSVFVRNSKIDELIKDKSSVGKLNVKMPLGFYDSQRRTPCFPFALRPDTLRAIPRGIPLRPATMLEYSPRSRQDSMRDWRDISPRHDTRRDMANDDYYRNPSARSRQYSYNLQEYETQALLSNQNNAPF